MRQKYFLTATQNFSSGRDERRHTGTRSENRTKCKGYDAKIRTWLNQMRGENEGIYDRRGKSLNATLLAALV
jgi:hypothetical protein